MIKQINAFMLALLFSCKTLPPSVPVDEFVIAKAPDPVVPDNSKLEDCERAFKKACSMMNNQFYFRYIDHKPSFECQSGKVTSYTVCDEDKAIVIRAGETMFDFYKED